MNHFSSKFLPIILFSFGIILPILWGIFHSFYWEDGNIMTFSWIVNSDWMMHLTQVQNFSALPMGYVAMHHPIYSGDILSYPFFVNWFSGVLLALSHDLVFSMLIPAFLGITFLIGSVYFLFFALSKNHWITTVGITLFLLSGGLQIFQIWGIWTWNEWKNLHDFTFDQAVIKLGYHWKSVFLTTMLPQRSYAWGMGMGAFSLALFISQFFRLVNTNSLQKKYGLHLFSFFDLLPFFAIGLLLGCISFLHTHSFVFLFLLFAGFTLFYIRYFFLFLSIGFGAIISAFPFLWLLAHKSSSLSEIAKYPLHMGEPYTKESFLVSFFHFWTLNWGILFLLLFLFFIPQIWRWIFSDCSKEKTQFLQILFGLAFVLFFAFSYIKMQSNPWDNTKLWLWSSVVFSFFIASFFWALWKKNILGKIVSLILFLVSIASGVLMLISGFNDSPTMVFPKSDLETAKKISEIVNPKDIVLTDDYFHLPFTALVPKQSFLGYRGWIASYGMETSYKTMVMERVFSGHPDALELLKKENIKYVLVDSSARANFKVNDAFFDKFLVLVQDFGNWGKLYRMK